MYKDSINTTKLIIRRNDNIHDAERPKIYSSKLKSDRKFACTTPILICLIGLGHTGQPL